MATEPDKDDDEAPEIKARSENIAKRKRVRDKLLDLYKEIEKGFIDQKERSADILEYWDLYNCKLGSKQFYQGNAEIFVPIVYEAVQARVTRFTNQIFPPSGRYVECTSSDATLPQATMALAEHYVRKAKLRSLIPALMLNGDIEGQYTVYVHWNKTTRHVMYRTQTPVSVDETLTGEDVEDIKEETIEGNNPLIEIISDSDFLVLPTTADSIPEALENGGSVTVLRRWSKAKIKRMIEDDEIDKAAGEAMIEEMGQGGGDQVLAKDKEKHMVQAGGVNSSGGKHSVVYETWSMVKLKEGMRLCRTYFGGSDRVLAGVRNPNWNDRVPIISEPVKKVQGSFKGNPLVGPVAGLQYFANDIMNEAADSASYSMLPIIMTDPEKNPRIGSMVLSLAAVWQTNPNDTKFAEFPQLWKDGLEIVASTKQEIFQALSVNPAMIPQGAKKKQSQAEVANEQQVDVLTTADAVTAVETGVLTPLVTWFMEMDHQYRENDIMIRSYGDMGKRAVMEEIKPLQMDQRYEFRWFGVEAARNAQQVQQQIAGLNVLRGIPPQLYPGYKLNIAPAMVQMVENIFGPRLGPLIFEDIKSQMSNDPKIEVELATEGIETLVHPLDNHQVAMQLLVQALKETKDPTGVIRAQLVKHQQILMQQAQAQQQAMQPKGGPGAPGGAGPGVAGGPRPGAQPRPPHGAQQPPGMIHKDQLHDPRQMPRRMG